MNKDIEMKFNILLNAFLEINFEQLKEICLKLYQVEIKQKRGKAILTQFKNSKDIYTFIGKLQILIRNSKYPYPQYDPENPSTITTENEEYCNKWKNELRKYPRTLINDLCKYFNC